LPAVLLLCLISSASGLAIAKLRSDALRMWNWCPLLLMAGRVSGFEDPLTRCVLPGALIAHKAMP
jgi:hypothetical protein